MSAMLINEIHHSETKTKKNYLPLYVELWSVYVGNKIDEWDDLSEIVNGFKTFGTLTRMSVSKHVSEYQEKLLISF